jgi:hypothetical protein
VVARAFGTALALVFANAFLSLGAQVQLLIGSRGLLPLAPFLENLNGSAGLSAYGFPTLFWLAPGDRALAAGIWVGVALSALALLGVASRACFALLSVLYLSYATACREFLGFQWDNLLIECGVLAAFLPRDRAAPVAHLLFRVLLWKLYFESGVAKWQSHLGDWQDGSAMNFYYETAPIPTALAWYAHHLPGFWHALESRLTLVLELLVPFAIFAPRALRLGALAALTGFQLVNLATANYGFFVWLALALHLFMLDDGDLLRARAWLARWAGGDAATTGPAAPPRRPPLLVRLALAPLVAFYLGASLNEAMWAFTEWSAWRQATVDLRALYLPFRSANVYHLFGHITRERTEPEFQVLAGDAWTSPPMHYKPGPADRAPPFVAPHQPRVDFRLWFYGLGYQRGMPLYVQAILARLCADPDAVQPLFAAPLPRDARAARVAFRQYRFTTREQARATGAWWTQSWIGVTQPLRCNGAAAGAP